jgi:hypothetical protein
MRTHLQPLLRLRAARIAGILPMIFAAALFFPTKAHASERWATLEAIHQLENPQDSSEPGTNGELGAYQFREDTWKMHTSAPFRRALDRRASDVVAVKHYEWIKCELERRGVAPTPYRIALAWNGGIGAVFLDNPPASAVDYAARAANLAAFFEKNALANSLADAR